MMTSLLFLSSLAFAVPTETGEIEPTMQAGPDRTQRPEVKPAVAMTHAEPTRETELAPGVTVDLIPTSSWLTNLTVSFGHGSIEVAGHETAFTEALGGLWDVCTTTHSPSELEVLKDLNDISISSYMSPHELTFSVQAPKHSLDLATELLAQVIHEPCFDGRELKRWKRDEVLSLTDEAPNTPSMILSYALSHAWYPSDHPYGARPDVAAYGDVKRHELIEAATQFRVSAPVHVQFVGDVSMDEATEMTRRIVRDAGDPSPRSEALAIPDHKGTRVIAIDVPGLPQTSIAMRMDGPTLDHVHSTAFEAANFALGGTFLARLNANLREEKGFTYGIYSRYSARPVSGTWSTFVEVKAENTGAAAREIRHELDRMANGGATPEEILAFYRDEVASWNDMFRTAQQAARSYGSVWDNSRTMAEELERIQSLRQLQGTDTMKAAADWLAEDAGRVWVFVGDRATIEPQLTELGLTPQWVSPQQAVLGAGF
ncbi:MAG: M16 family metallopeptidase [Myxococcota bacterium]